MTRNSCAAGCKRKFDIEGYVAKVQAILLTFRLPACLANLVTVPPGA